MEQTVPQICKVEEDFEKLQKEGFELKVIKNLKYLIKNEKVN